MDSINRPAPNKIFPSDTNSPVWANDFYYFYVIRKSHGSISVLKLVIYIPFTCSVFFEKKTCIFCEIFLDYEKLEIRDMR